MKRKLLPAVIIIIGCVFAFSSFSRTNEDRVISENDSYIEEAANQKASRLDYIFSDNLDSIRSIALLYGTSLNTPDVDLELLKDLENNTSFDWIRFVDVNGTNYTSDGESVDVSDREYFKDGMNGKTDIFNSSSRINGEKMVGFYSPVDFNGEVIGVLIGLCSENTLSDILSGSFFGYSAEVFLCTGEGDIIAGSTTMGDMDSIYDFTDDKKYFSESESENFHKSFKASESTVFHYEGTAGRTGGYLLPLETSDWMLIQTFPSNAAQKIISDANSAGAKLQIEIIILFVIYIVYLTINALHERNILKKQARNSSYVASGIQQIFNGFVLVDLEEDTYEYLLSKPKDIKIAVKGKFEDYRNYITENIYNEKDRSSVKELIKKECLYEVSNLNFNVHTKENGDHWDNISVCRLEEKNGKTVKFLFVRQDVTEMKQIEMKEHMALQEAYKLAEQSNRSKTTFLFNMSHDIRTPLNAIIGFTALADSHADNPQLVKDYLSKIALSGNQLLDLINDVLDMSRIESGKIQIEEKECHISEVLKDLRDVVLHDFIEHDLDFYIDMTNVRNNAVWCDKLRLNQILLNLLGNAIKFTPSGGKVSVSVYENDGAPEGYGSFTFCIKDTGIGMSKEFQKHVFEAFERENTSTVSGIQGTGLGMYITKTIVGLMGGSISVVSKKNKGTEFIINVEFRLQSGKHEFKPAPELKGLKALVVSDDKDTCKTMSKMLGLIGVGSEVVTNAERALDLIKQRAGINSFDMFILGRKLPDMSVIELTKKIKAQAASVPIIMTGYDWSDIQEEAQNAGVSVFCGKPLFLSELHGCICEALSIKVARNNHEDKKVLKSVNLSKRILLAEDNELNKEIAVEILESFGYKVESVSNGKEAYEALEKSSAGYFNAVLMDIQMPVMDGYEATRKIREMNKTGISDIPIIAMTANAFEEDKRMAVECGMNGHLAKPINIDKLKQTLDDMLG